MERVDVAVVGAGPVGLTLGARLGSRGLRVRLIDPQPAAVLAAPLPDGREIAINHASRAGLLQAGIWSRLDPAAIWPLQQACVRDRHLPFALDVETATGADEPLGWLVANWRLRQAAWEAATAMADCRVLDGRAVQGVCRGRLGWELALSDGSRLEADVVIAADSRFSAARRLLGVGAHQHEDGTAMVVRPVSLERDHHHRAWQWFGNGVTRALLPLGPCQASAVLTLPAVQARALMALDDEAWSNRVSGVFEHRWGRMQPLGNGHCHPMVMVLAHRFAGPGFALAGDAAVGMHPVTAHGFNLGVRSAVGLAGVLAAGGTAGERDRALQVWGTGHRRAVLPLYAATRLVAGLYGNNALPARVVRGGALALAAGLPAFRQRLRDHLTATG